MKHLVSVFLCVLLMTACTDQEKASEERNYPLAFLTLKQYKRDSISSKMEGEILNHAQYTHYGNIGLMVTYYSHRGTNIGTEVYPHYQPIKPGRRAHYSLELHPPPPPQKEVKKIELKIIGAGVYSQE